MLKSAHQASCQRRPAIQAIKHDPTSRNPSLRWDFVRWVGDGPLLNKKRS